MPIGSNQADPSPVIYHPAHILYRQVREVAADGTVSTPTGPYTPEERAHLTALLMQRMYDPSLLGERPPFFFPAEISNNLLDAYDTRMHSTTLRNYAADANDGRALQDSHKHTLGIGYSLTGRLLEQPGAMPDGSSLITVRSDFYTLPGMRLGDLSTDDFILGVRSGLIRDVSVGFSGGEYRCSICGDNMMSWDCTHWPGEEYARLDNEGNAVGAPERAFAWIMNAHLNEVSAVYDGATPDAGIGPQKAMRFADAGLITAPKARLLEQRYRIKLPVSTQYRGVEVPTPEEKDTMAELKITLRGAELTPERIGEIEAAVLAQFGVEAAIEATPDPEPPAPSGEPAERVAPAPESHPAPSAEAEREEDAVTEAEVRALLAEAGAPEGERDMRWLVRELAAHKSAAVDGRAARQVAVERALGEYVRAFGGENGEADAEAYRGMLETAPLSTVEKMTTEWRSVGDARFKGGRATEDGETEGSAGATPPAESRTFWDDVVPSRA